MAYKSIFGGNSSVPTPSGLNPSGTGYRSVFQDAKADVSVPLNAGIETTYYKSVFDKPKTVEAKTVSDVTQKFLDSFVYSKGLKMDTPALPQQIARTDTQTSPAPTTEAGYLLSSPGLKTEYFTPETAQNLKNLTSLTDPKKPVNLFDQMKDGLKGLIPGTAVTLPKMLSDGLTYIGAAKTTAKEYIDKVESSPVGEAAWAIAQGTKTGRFLDSFSGNFNERLADNLGWDMNDDGTKKALNIINPGKIYTEVGTKLKEDADARMKAHPEWARPDYFHPDNTLDGVIANLQDQPVAYLTRAFTENAPQIALQVLLALTTGGVGSMIFMGSSAAGNTYQESIDAGKAEEEALIVGTVRGSVEAALEGTGLDNLLAKGASRKIGESFAKHLIKKVGEVTWKATVEGLTEFTQQVVANAIALTYDENRGLLDGAWASGLAGFISGAPTAGVSAILQGSGIDTNVDADTNVSNQNIIPQINGGSSQPEQQATPPGSSTAGVNAPGVSTTLGDVESTVADAPEASVAAPVQDLISGIAEAEVNAPPTTGFGATQAQPTSRVTDLPRVQIEGANQEGQAFVLNAADLRRIQGEKFITDDGQNLIEAPTNEDALRVLDARTITDRDSNFVIKYQNTDLSAKELLEQVSPQGFDVVIDRLGRIAASQETLTNLQQLARFQDLKTKSELPTDLRDVIDRYASVRDLTLAGDMVARRLEAQGVDIPKTVAPDGISLGNVDPEQVLTRLAEIQNGAQVAPMRVKLTAEGIFLPKPEDNITAAALRQMGQDVPVSISPTDLLNQVVKQFGYDNLKEYFDVREDVKAFRRGEKTLPSFSEKKGKTDKVLSRTEAERIVRRYFKDSEVALKFVPRLLTPAGREAYGSYSKGMITFAENPDITTPTHEVLHAYFDLFTSPVQKAEVLREVGRKFKVSDRIEQEEILADEFVKYARTRDEAKWSDKVIRFFNDVLNGLQSLVGLQSRIDTLFNDLYELKRPAEVYTDGLSSVRAMYQTAQDLTLKIFDVPEIQKKSEYSQTELRNIINTGKNNLKQAEKQFLEGVLDTYFIDAKKISLAELNRAVQTELTPVTIIETSSYADIGYDDKFSDKGTGTFLESENPEFKSVILNTNVDHGYVGGHWKGEYSRDEEIPKKIVEFPTKPGMFAVIVEGVKLTEDNLQENVLHVGSQESALEYVRSSESLFQPVTKGLLSHYRVARDRSDTTKEAVDTIKEEIRSARRVFGVWKIMNGFAEGTSFKPFKVDFYEDSIKSMVKAGENVAKVLKDTSYIEASEEQLRKLTDLFPVLALPKEDLSNQDVRKWLGEKGLDVLRLVALSNFVTYDAFRPLSDDQLLAMMKVGGVITDESLKKLQDDFSAIQKDPAFAGMSYNQQTILASAKQIPTMADKLSELAFLEGFGRTQINHVMSLAYGTIVSGKLLDVHTQHEIKQAIDEHDRLAETRYLTSTNRSGSEAMRIEKALEDYAKEPETGFKSYLIEPAQSDSIQKDSALEKITSEIAVKAQNTFENEDGYELPALKQFYFLLQDGYSVLNAYWKRTDTTPEILAKMSWTVPKEALDAGEVWHYKKLSNGETSKEFDFDTSVQNHSFGELRDRRVLEYTSLLQDDSERPKNLSVTTVVHLNKLGLHINENKDGSATVTVAKALYDPKTIAEDKAKLRAKVTEIEGSHEELADLVEKRNVFMKKFYNVFRKNWFEFTARKQIQEEARNGASEVLYPSLLTIAKIEGYVDRMAKNVGGETKFSDKSLNDVFEFEGREVRVVEETEDSIVIVNEEDVIEDGSERMADDIQEKRDAIYGNTQYGITGDLHAFGIEYESLTKEQAKKLPAQLEKLKKLKADGKIPTKTFFQSLPQGLQSYIKDLKRLDYASFTIDFPTEQFLAKVASGDNVEDALQYVAEQEAMAREDALTFDELYSADYDTMETPDGSRIAYTNATIMSLQKSSEDGDAIDGFFTDPKVFEENYQDGFFSRADTAVLNFYKSDYLPYIEKFRAGNLETVTDSEGNVWRSTKITPEDKGAMTFFQEKTADQIVAENIVKSTATTKQAINQAIKGTKPEAVLKTEKQLLKASLRAQRRVARSIVKNTQQRLAEQFANKLADIRKVKTYLTEYLKMLPLSERGKMITLVRDAETIFDLAKATNRVNVKMEEVEKREVIAEIRKAYNRILESPGVDVGFKALVSGIFNEIQLQGKSNATMERLAKLREFIQTRTEKGEPVYIQSRLLRQLEILDKTPIKEIPVEQLEAMLSDMELLEDQGRLKKELRYQAYRRQVESIAESVMPELYPIDRPEYIKKVSGEDLTKEERLTNAATAIKRTKLALGKAIRTMDVFFDMFSGGKGLYNTQFFTQFKGRVDGSFQGYLQEKDRLIEPINDLARSLQLTEAELERIGTYAQLKQEGGLDKLIQLGLKQADLEQIQLTEREMKFYDAMREKFAETYPHLKEYMARVYNKDIGSVENYFPMVTNWDEMSEVDMLQRFGTTEVDSESLSPGLSGRPKKNVIAGSTIERKRGAQQKIITNALVAYKRHMDNAIYMLEMGETIRTLGDVIKVEGFKESIGDYGYQILLEYIDLLARKGGKQNDPSVRWLDMFRKNASIGVMGLKLSSILVQPSAFGNGAADIGTEYALKGAAHLALDPDWRAFAIENMPELKARVGNDPAFAEVDEISRYQKFKDFSMDGLKFFDAKTAATIAMGAYEKYMDDHGLEVDLNDPNKDALAYAQLKLRKTQGSNFFKDQPLMYSRGAFTGSRSIDRTLGAFQSFMVNNWNWLSYDFPERIKRDPKQAVEAATWLLMAQLYTITAQALSKDILAAIFGGEGEEDPFMKRLAFSFFNNIPFVSQLFSTIEYGSTPVPLISTTNKIGDATKTIFGEGKPATKAKAAVRAASGVGTLMGIPGSTQAGDVVTRLMTGDK